MKYRILKKGNTYPEYWIQSSLFGIFWEIEYQYSNSFDEFLPCVYLNLEEAQNNLNDLIEKRKLSEAKKLDRSEEKIIIEVVVK